MTESLKPGKCRVKWFVKSFPLQQPIVYCFIFFLVLWGELLLLFRNIFTQIVIYCKSFPASKPHVTAVKPLCPFAAVLLPPLDALTLFVLLPSAEKPLPQGPPGGVIGILGGVVAIGLIVGVAVTVFMVHRRQQKTRTETDNDL